MTPLVITTILTISALLTAMISGMIGLGGGTVLVVILYSVGLNPVVAVTVHAAVQLVSNAARTLAFLKHVHLPSFGIFLITAVPTPFLVADAVGKLDPTWVRLWMGIFILAVTWLKKYLKAGLQGPPAMLLAGLCAGGLGMVVGATGTLIAPFYLRDGWKKETIIGTKALCQASAHVFKLVAFSTVSLSIGEHWDIIVPMAIAVFIGIFAGKALGQRVSETWFRRIFKGLLTLLALKLIISAAMKLAAA